MLTELPSIIHPAPFVSNPGLVMSSMVSMKPRIGRFVSSSTTTKYPAVMLDTLNWSLTRSVSASRRVVTMMFELSMKSSALPNEPVHVHTLVES